MFSYNYTASFALKLLLGSNRYSPCEGTSAHCASSSSNPHCQNKLHVHAQSAQLPWIVFRYNNFKRRGSYLCISRCTVHHSRIDLNTELPTSDEAQRCLKLVHSTGLKTSDRNVRRHTLLYDVIRRIDCGARSKDKRLDCKDGKLGNQPKRSK